MEAPPPETTSSALREVYRQIGQAQANVTHADTKAALLAAGAIPITALLAASPALTGPLAFSKVTSWTAIAFMLAGIGLLGAVVWPRLSGRSGIRSGANRSTEQIVAKARLISSSPERQLQDAAEEFSLLATLAFAKFRRIQWAMLCFAAGGVFMLMAVAA